MQTALSPHHVVDSRPLLFRQTSHINIVTCSQETKTISAHKPTYIKNNRKYKKMKARSTVRKNRET